MKKRSLLVVLLVCLSCFCFLFSGCSQSLTLDYGVKYYKEEDISIGKNRENSDYYMFYKNGTGKYRYRYAYNEEVTDYTITFKYTQVDTEGEAVACFYDSVEYAPEHNVTDAKPHEWSTLLTVSKNVLMTKGGMLFVSEEYLEELPNFGKAE